jgi:hypothetical protein
MTRQQEILLTIGAILLVAALLALFMHVVPTPGCCPCAN